MNRLRRWLSIAILGRPSWDDWLADHEARTSAPDLPRQEVRPQ